jgi:hypothetical protein
VYAVEASDIVGYTPLITNSALSNCASQAGAKKVYAVEASDIVGYTRQLASGNTSLGPKLEVLHAKAEEVSIPEKVSMPEAGEVGGYTRG